jgi:hypothetical protein
MKTPGWNAFYFAKLSLLLVILFTACPRAWSQDKVPVEIRDSLGKVKEKGFTLQGQRTGMWTFYDNYGQVSRKIKYRKNAAIWTFLYENGNITESINRKGKVRKRSCNCPN